MIWLITLAMTLAALAIILMPLFKTCKLQSAYRTAQNIGIARERIALVQQQRDKGELTEEEFQSAKHEIENSLYHDMTVNQKEEGENQDLAVDYKTGRVLLIVLPVLIFSLYYALGNADLATLQNRQISLSPPHVTNTTTVAQVPDVRTLFEALKKRLESHPDDGQGWMMMGLSYMHFGQYQKAVAAYQKAVQLLPNNTHALAGLKRAQAALSDRTSTSNTPPVISRTMTAPNSQVVDVGAMVMKLRKKLDANPDNIQGWRMLARSYKYLGQRNDAIYACQQALKIQPADPQILSLLAVLKHSEPANGK